MITKCTIVFPTYRFQGQPFGRYNHYVLEFNRTEQTVNTSSVPQIRQFPDVNDDHTVFPQSSTTRCDLRIVQRDRYAPCALAACHKLIVVIVVKQFDFYD